MKIESVALHHIELPLVAPFEASFGRQTVRPAILIEVRAEGLTGWGECVAFGLPWYSYETVGTAWHMLTEPLIAPVLGVEFAHPDELLGRLGWVRGHHRRGQRWRRPAGICTPRPRAAPSRRCSAGRAPASL